MKAKQIDFLVIILLTALNLVYGYITRGTFWGKPSIVGVIGLIAGIVYLGIRKKKNWKKIAIATIIFGGIFGFIFEFSIDYNKSYILEGTLFPSLFGFLQLDNVFGHVIMACFTFVFYEHFVERDINSHISKNLPFALLPGIFVCGVLIFEYYFQKQRLFIPYTYFTLGLVAIIPPILLGFFKPRFIKNMAETTVFFFFFWLAYELLAVKLGYWIYPGNNYVGWVTLFGISFPIEELLFWMFFYSASLVSYYEITIDTHAPQKKLKHKYNHR